MLQGAGKHLSPLFHIPVEYSSFGIPNNGNKFVPFLIKNVLYRFQQLILIIVKFFF